LIDRLIDRLIISLAFVGVVTSSEELKCRTSSDAEFGDFFAIQQLVDCLPNGKLIKLEVITAENWLVLLTGEQKISRLFCFRSSMSYVPETGAVNRLVTGPYSATAKSARQIRAASAKWCTESAKERRRRKTGRD